MNCESERRYQAIIWRRDSDDSGKRVSVGAASLTEAKEKLRLEFGEEAVISLHNEEDASCPRTLMKQ